jgi:hypothetical protein
LLELVLLPAIRIPDPLSMGKTEEISLTKPGLKQ